MKNFYFVSKVFGLLLESLRACKEALLSKSTFIIMCWDKCIAQYLSK